MPRQSGYHSDAPAVRGRVVRDDLGFSDFRPALVEILTTAETPLTVGIFGPWGSGKTSLLQMLQRDLDEKHAEDTETVWFTAWKYDRHEALWRAFILRVLDALQPGELAPEATKTARRRHDELVRKLDRLEESLYREVEWKEVGRLVADWSRLLPEAGKAAGELAAALIPGGDVVRRILRALAAGDKDSPDLPGAAGAIRREVHQHFRAQLTSMEQFETTFQEALKLALGGRRLVVFVDDLDRCLPEKALEVLEAIKLFLEVPGTEFVLGMDAGVVERGIETRYGTLFRPEGRDGEERSERGELPITGSAYLQKIVQIPFHLPALAVEDLEGFIAGVEKDIPDAVKIGDVARGVVARGALPNPRQVKRALNILRLLRGIARTREEAGSLEADAITDPLLAKTVLIQTQWPELYREWRLRPTLVRTLEEEYLRRPASEEEIFRGRAPTGADEEKTLPAVGGLLGPYLSQRRRYALLERMLAYPPPAEAPEEKRRRARFGQLEPPELEAYTRLAGTVPASRTGAEEAPAAVASGDLMAEMLSGDPARVREAVARLGTQEPDAAGPQHQAARRQLLEAMRSTVRPARERAGAGDALGRLGDPRFDLERWLLPGEPTLGFVAIPGGRFEMGSDEKADPESFEDERPQLPVELPSYWMGRFPVTAGQFRIFAQERGDAELLERLDRQPANHPVVVVSWYEAGAYVSWLRSKLKAMAPQRLEAAGDDAERAFWQGLASGEIGAALPSEAEWEKAARWDGERSRIYPWGDQFDAERANSAPTGVLATSAVGCFAGGVSPYGCEEMAGNVWEWTRSLWGKEVEKPEWGYPYAPQDGREDLDASSEVARVLRGGAFVSDPGLVRCACRSRGYPVSRVDFVGFRVVLSPFSSGL
jgi:formylglycine-generating enzyme required for sulfatase activity